MINIFYNPSYFKKKKVFITKSFKHSIFYNVFIDVNYFFNLPLNENLITSGPQKRMNNLLKTFRNHADVALNSYKYRNNYIVQFDSFGQEVFKNIIQDKKTDTRVLIGPLYSIEQDKMINQITNNYKNVKKVVASKTAFENSFEFDNNFKSDTAVILPSGVENELKVRNNLKIKNRENKILIYYKKRSKEELKNVIDFLSNKGHDYVLFEYGNYKNKELINFAKKCMFGITVCGTESQGFAIQELMSCNLPLLVWDYNINKYEDFVLSGTTVPYWDDICGMIVKNKQELYDNYDEFLNNLSKYSPASFILDKLTYEKFSDNLINSFNF